MRLMIIGNLEGPISQAGRIALQRGAKVSHCEDVQQAMGALRNGKGADLIMMDVKLRISEMVKALDEERIYVPVVGCGLGDDARSAVNAIKDGAKEYIPLPPDVEMIAAILEAVTQDDKTMIASDASMQPVLKLLEKIAPSEATVLISGESGTGKEVMARAVHAKSKRNTGPFIAVNCAAIPENLLESELFGHEKGAFTGAAARRIGKFEEANTGTLLLDEVSEMHPLLQAKLLRAIQEREITRIGNNDPVKVDVRILATTNRNLADSVEKGDFREDLYYRLNVVNIALPPLRERPNDLAKLAQHFADKYADQNGVAKKQLSTDAIKKIQGAYWRGNIRELENTMHRAILVSLEDEIEPDDIQTEGGLHIPTSGGVASQQPAPTSTPQTPISNDTPIKDITSLQNPGAVEGLIGRTVADVERDLILNTLDHCIGNRTHAANILGISIRTLRNKLNQYKDDGIDVPASNAN